MERYRQLKEMLHAELDRIQKKGELTANSLEQADVLAHTLKDIATIEAMEAEEGYSEHYPMPYYRGGYYDDGGSYGPGRGRGSNARRDSMGRYSSDSGRSYDGRASYNDGGSYENNGSYENGQNMSASYRGR